MKSHVCATKGVATVNQLEVNEVATARLAPAFWFHRPIPLPRETRTINKRIELVTSQHLMYGSLEDSANNRDAELTLCEEVAGGDVITSFAPKPATMASM